MTPAEDELVAAIWDDPAADGPRQVYADWLQEQGDPLGEYLQLVNAPSDPAVTARLRELDMSARWLEWFGSYPTSVDRGMPTAVNLSAKKLDQSLLSHLRGTLVSDLSLSSDYELTVPQLRVFLRALERMRLRRLWVEGMRAETMAEVLESRELAGLEELWIRRVLLGDESARQIARRAALPALTTLIAPGYYSLGMGDAGVTALHRAGLLARVHTLDVSSHKIGPSGAAAVLDDRSVVTSLDLSGNPLGPAGVQAILAAPGAWRLTSLAIGGVGLDAASVRALAAAPELAGLKRLALAASTLDSGLGPADLDALIASPYLSRQLRLELDGRVLGLEERESIDGMSGQPAWSWWEGDPPPRLAERFQVVVVGYPSV